jgi:23S rRNA pseudouridine1911/1915/1917 synthase
MMAQEHRFRVESPCELLSYLINLPLGLSRKQAKNLIRFRAVTVQRMTRIRHDTRLEAGDVLTIAAAVAERGAALEHGLRIIHLDDAIVVVDKPAGLLSMGSGREKQRTVHRILNEHLKTRTRSPRQQAFIVHRLDRETSGLMVFARSESAQAALQRNWKSVTKKYLAVVKGVPRNAHGTLTDHLVERKSFLVHRVDNGGQLAITHYRVLRTVGDKSLLELTLETGRKHQIRVQLATLGHPIVGDRRYGASDRTEARLALHSCQLTFRHPVSGASMEFRSALPTSLSALVERRGARGAKKNSKPP